jgi:hypothetical protein
MQPDTSDDTKRHRPFSALELEGFIKVHEAAKLRGISPDIFKRHFRHLIRQLSPRRQGVKLSDALISD